MPNYPSNRRYHQQALISFLQQNADRPVTLDELSMAVNGARSSVSSALGRMIELYPNLERRQRGIYVWHAVAKEDVPTELLVKVLKQTRDGGLVVMDELTETLYTMRELEI